MAKNVWIACGTVVAGLIAWECVASFLFLEVQGFWEAYPWPDKALMWLRYWLKARDNAIVERWLLITGIVSLVIPGLMLSILIKWLTKARPPTVYGESEFADAKAMRKNGIKSSGSPL